jgi:hypothetical protein
MYLAQTDYHYTSVVCRIDGSYCSDPYYLWYYAGQYSDARLKKNVEALDSGLDVLSKLRPVSFYWKEDTEQGREDKRLQYGFIAQEVQEVLPEVVRERGEIRAPVAAPAAPGSKDAAPPPPIVVPDKPSSVTGKSGWSALVSSLLSRLARLFGADHEEPPLAAGPNPALEKPSQALSSSIVPVPAPRAAGPLPAAKEPSLNEKLDKTLRLNSTELIPFAIRAIQELKKENEDYRRQLEELRRELEGYKARAPLKALPVRP